MEHHKFHFIEKPYIYVEHLDMFVANFSKENYYLYFSTLSVKTASPIIMYFLVCFGFPFLFCVISMGFHHEVHLLLRKKKVIPQRVPIPRTG